MSVNFLALRSSKLTIFNTSVLTASQVGFNYTKPVLIADAGIPANATAGAPRGIGAPLIGIGNSSWTSGGVAGDYYGIGFGFGGGVGGANYYPAEIGLYVTSSSGNTVGDIVFSTRASTNNVVASERMRITNAGNVGIGTANPYSKFTLTSGYSAGATGGFCIDASDANAYRLYLHPYIQADSKVAYQFSVSNLTTTSSSLSIGYNGNVGIGNASPGNLLSVGAAALPSANSAGTTNLVVYGNINCYRNRLIFSDSLADWNHSIYNNSRNLDNEGAFDGMKFNVYAGAWFRVSGTPATSSALFINSTGVGIGTTNPSTKLHVVGGSTTTESLIVSGLPINTGLAAYTGNASTTYTLPYGIGLYFLHFHYGNPVSTTYPSSVWQVFYDGITAAVYTKMFSTNGPQFGQITSAAGNVLTINNGGAWWGYDGNSALYVRVTKIC